MQRRPAVARVQLVEHDVLPEWAVVVATKLMPEIGVTVSVAAALVREPAQLLTTTTKLPDEARFKFEMARLDPVAPAMGTPLERH